MTLPEDDPKAFNGLVNWLYRDQLPTFPTTEFPATAEGCDAFYSNILQPLFFLGEKLCINELSNRLMDNMQYVGQKYSRTPGAHDIKLAYENTHQDSKLRCYHTLMQIFSVRYTNCGEHKDFKEYAELAAIHPEIGRDYMQLDAKFGHILHDEDRDPQLRDGDGLGRCFFHTHAKNEVCHLELVESENYVAG